MDNVEVQENHLYFLITGELTLSMGDELFTLAENTVIYSDSGKEGITRRDLLKASQALTDTAEENYKDATVERCVITNIVPLGYFTQDEWNEPIEGLN